MKKLASHIFLIFLSIISIGPFLWLLSTALKGSNENIFAYPPQIIPQFPTFANFIDVWTQIPFVAYFSNSFIVAIFTIILNLILSSLSGYALARMSFRGKNFIFYTILATIMIPFQTIMIPVYLITLKLGLVDSVSRTAGFLGLILPFSVNAFGIFLMRQAFLSVPKELEEASVIDGANAFTTWFHIMMPMVSPFLATLAIFTFVGSWSEFLWPSIVITKQEMFTLPVGLNYLQSSFSSNWRLIAAGAIISIIPILIIFLALQKYFIQDVAGGAVKE